MRGRGHATLMEVCTHVHGAAVLFVLGAGALIWRRPRRPPAGGGSRLDICAVMQGCECSCEYVRGREYTIGGGNDACRARGCSIRESLDYLRPSSNGSVNAESRVGCVWMLQGQCEYMETVNTWVRTRVMMRAGCGE